MRHQWQLRIHPRQRIVPAYTESRSCRHRRRRRQLYRGVHRFHTKRKKRTGSTLTRRADLRVCLHQERRNANSPPRTDRVIVHLYSSSVPCSRHYRKQGTVILTTIIRISLLSTKNGRG